jgi:hypothetical protein
MVPFDRVERLVPGMVVGEARCLPSGPDWRITTVAKGTFRSWLMPGYATETQVTVLVTALQPLCNVPNTEYGFRVADLIR